jgi:hypothetical protein
MATLTLENRKKIISFISHFSKTAKENNWVAHYDVESDSFAITKPKLSKESQKKYFDDEFAFYLKKNGEVEGIFIEYFTTNFISHNSNFKAILDNLKKTDKNEDVIELKRGQTNKVARNLEEFIIESMNLHKCSHSKI